MILGSRTETDVEEQDGEKCRNQETERKFLADGVVGNFDWANNGGETENEKNVEDTTPDYVAEDHISAPGSERGHGDGKFGRASAEGDDGKPDEHFGDFEVFGRARCSVNKNIGTLNQKDKTDDQ